MSNELEIIAKIENNTLIYEIIWKDNSFIWKKIKLKVAKNYNIDIWLNIGIQHQEEFIFNWYHKNIINNFNKENYFNYFWKEIKLYYILRIIADKWPLTVIYKEKIIDNDLSINTYNLKNEESIKLYKINDKINFLKNFKSTNNINKAIIILSIIFVILSIPILFFILKEKYSNESLDPRVVVVAIFTFYYFLIIIYRIIKSNLSKYINIYIKDFEIIENINQKYEISKIIWWKSKVDLKNIKVEIIAFNIEKYNTWWKDSKSVNYPINSIILFSKNIDYISKEIEVSEYIKWEFSFENIFNYFSPNQSSWNLIHDDIWIYIECYIKISSDDFADLKIYFPNNIFKKELFKSIKKQ